MKTYRQYCAIARALDVVGDRWTLLIIRELMAGPRRFGELSQALPGIATNLLTARLRSLETSELIERQGQQYRLTSTGRELAPLLRELVRFGSRYMRERGTDEFRPHWLALAAQSLLTAPKNGKHTVVRLASSAAVITLDCDDHGAHVSSTEAEPDITLSGTPDAILAMLSAPRTPRPEVTITGPLDQLAAITFG